MAHRHRDRAGAFKGLGVTNQDFRAINRIESAPHIFRAEKLANAAGEEPLTLCRRNGFQQIAQVVLVEG